MVPQLDSFIGGQFRPGPREFPDIHPADGSVIACVSEATSDMVDEAVTAAQQAHSGAWGRTTVRDRAAALNRIADSIHGSMSSWPAK